MLKMDMEEPPPFSTNMVFKELQELTLALFTYQSHWPSPLNERSPSSESGP